MPANLSPEYLKVEEQYARAKTLKERIELTEELIKLAPKHKGTEKLLKMLKQRLAKLRRELREKETKKAGKSTLSFAVKKEGAAQLVLVGFPNSGKSTLLRRLTAAKPQVADYPFTTVVPEPGMMEVGEVQIQVVEAPGVVEGSSEGRALGMKPLSLARTADAVVLVADASRDPVREVEILVRELEKAGVKLNQPSPALKVEERSSGGIEIEGGDLVEGGEEAVREVLQEYGLFNASVIIQEPLSRDRIREAIEGSTVYKKALILVTKDDTPGSGARVDQLRKRFGSGFRIIQSSGDLEEVKKQIFESLDLIRVYTKPPDGEPADRPLVVKRGATVLDVAKAVHKDIARELKHARIWGSTKFPGQQVSKNYEVKDGDVVELHT